MRQNPHFDFSHLSPPDRIQLALDLWESLEDPEREEAFAMTPELAAELDRRVAEMDADGDAGQPWEEVLEHIREEARSRQRGA